MIAWFVIIILGIIAATVLLMVIRAALGLFLAVKAPERPADDPDKPVAPDR